MKPFHELNGLDTTKEEWERNGYKVINFSQVKKEYLKVIDDEQLAHDYQMYNRYTTNKDKLMEEIYNKFQKIVFKESRGGGGRTVIGWENINSYLDYHSGIFYKWFN